jgi:hypothetical protein
MHTIKACKHAKETLSCVELQIVEEMSALMDFHNYLVEGKPLMTLQNRFITFITIVFT